VGAGVEPGTTPAHDFDIELVAFKGKCGSGRKFSARPMLMALNWHNKLTSTAPKD
jgi:hypothetical protein